MYIKQGTIDHFKALGIEVKNHPGTESEWREKVWNEEYTENYNYYKTSFKGWDENGRAKYPSHEELHTSSIRWANTYTPRRMNDWYNAKELFIEYDDNGNHRVIVQSVKVKSKEITVEYVEKLIAKDKKQYAGTFGKFADAMNRLLRAIGVSNYCSVYPTTYGIGVWHFYNFHFDKDKELVENVLKSNDIEYRNEYSDKMWAYRYIISKKQANIELALAV